MYKIIVEDDGEKLQEITCDAYVLGIRQGSEAGTTYEIGDETEVIWKALKIQNKVSE